MKTDKQLVEVKAFTLITGAVGWIPAFIPQSHIHSTKQ